MQHFTLAKLSQKENGFANGHDDLDYTHEGEEEEKSDIQMPELMQLTPHKGDLHQYVDKGHQYEEDDAIDERRKKERPVEDEVHHHHHHHHHEIDLQKLLERFDTDDVLDLDELDEYQGLSRPKKSKGTNEGDCSLLFFPASKPRCLLKLTFLLLNFCCRLARQVQFAHCQDWPGA